MFGDTLRRPPQEHTLAAKEMAVSYAAFRALVNLFPSQRTVAEGVMGGMGLDPTIVEGPVLDLSLPAQARSRAAQPAALLRRTDRAADACGIVRGGLRPRSYVLQRFREIEVLERVMEVDLKAFTAERREVLRGQLRGVREDPRRRVSCSPTNRERFC